MQQLEVLVVVVALLIAHQLVRLVTLVGILLLKVLLVVVMQLSKAAHTLRARAVAQAQRVKVLLAHQPVVMAVRERQILFLAHLQAMAVVVAVLFMVVAQRELAELVVEVPVMALETVQQEL
jgi:hypothetical protein